MSALHPASAADSAPTATKIRVLFIVIDLSRNNRESAFRHVRSAAPRGIRVNTPWSSTSGNCRKWYGHPESPRLEQWLESVRRAALQQDPPSRRDVRGSDSWDIHDNRAPLRMAARCDWDERHEGYARCDVCRSRNRSLCGNLPSPARIAPTTSCRSRWLRGSPRSTIRSRFRIACSQRAKRSPQWSNVAANAI